MERQETERVTDRQVIKSRQKKFFAFCLAILIGCMPTVNVMAETINVSQGTAGSMDGRTLNPGDELRWTSVGTGGMKVYYVSDGTSVDSGRKEDGEGFSHTIRTCDAKGFLNWKVEVNEETVVDPARGNYIKKYLI